MDKRMCNAECVSKCKKGRIFCPNSKAFSEEQLELSFIEVYNRMFSDDGKGLSALSEKLIGILDAQNTQELLEEELAKRQPLSVKKYKAKCRFDKGTLSQKGYEEKLALINKEENLHERIGELQILDNREKTARRRIPVFISSSKKRKKLEVFTKDIFEKMISQVIAGGIDEEGINEPQKLTFIFGKGIAVSDADQLMLKEVLSKCTTYKTVTDKTGSLIKYLEIFCFQNHYTKQTFYKKSNDALEKRTSFEQQVVVAIEIPKKD